MNTDELLAQLSKPLPKGKPPRLMSPSTRQILVQLNLGAAWISYAPPTRAYLKALDEYLWQVTFGTPKTNRALRKWRKIQRKHRAAIELAEYRVPGFRGGRPVPIPPGETHEWDDALWALGETVRHARWKWERKI